MQITPASNIHNQNFGMALHVDYSAQPVIDNQLLKLTYLGEVQFLNTLNLVRKMHSENKNTDIFVRKSKIRDALVADVVDNTKNGKTKHFSQPLFKTTVYDCIEFF